ncbi:MAG: GAF domain-containing protein [Anaerolineaceae bacterium]|nr:MAG: GAF domain-containing protein [Anaerolineaceae bacterium]
MNQLRTPAFWKLLLWFFALSLIPTGVVVVFVQRQMRDNVITGELDTIHSHAQAYAARAVAEPGSEQELAIEMMNITGGDAFFLLGADGIYITHSETRKIGRAASEDFSPDTLETMLSGKTGKIFDKNGGRLIGVYRASPDSPLAVSTAGINQVTENLNNFILDLLAPFMGAMLFAIFVAALIVFSFATPLIRITNYAREISKGNLNIQVNTRGLRGNMGALASNLVNFIKNMQNSILSLEQKVQDRDRELERRNKLLQAVSEVGRTTASYRNISELLQRTAYLIEEHFGYYHVGIFLLDERREYAVLTATNSEGGMRMLEKRHRLKVGGTSIVGYATENVRARIALDVGEDAIHFDNPDLPATRSEMALPLVSSGQLLGALDVQSIETQAFTEDDISTLQILAEQIAVAIQNAALFNETQKALESARLVYGETSREAWRKMLASQSRVGYIATTPGTVQKQTESLESTLAKAQELEGAVIGGNGLTLSAPLKIRGQLIGAIRLKKPDIAETWTQDEINLVNALMDQLSGALESARLYRESQQRAARESLVSDISARISAVSNTESIIREAVQELGQAFSNTSVTFQLAGQPDGRKQAEGPRRGETTLEQGTDL